jgi:hypothetical protein
VTAANLTGHDHCQYCADSGWVEVHSGDPVDAEWLRRVRKLDTRHRMTAGLQRAVYAESVAPCPKCEQGKTNEFPPDGKDGTPGFRLTPWGQDGYWQGRDHSWLRPLPDGKPMHASDAKAAAARAMADLDAAQNGRRP